MGGNRLRLGTGAVVKPEHWDEDLHQMHAQRGTPHASVNPRLNRAHEAAEAARKLLKEELKAAIYQAMQLAPVAEPAAPAAQPATNCIEGNAPLLSRTLEQGLNLSWYTMLSCLIYFVRRQEKLLLMKCCIENFVS